MAAKRKRKRKTRKRKTTTRRNKRKTTRKRRKTKRKTKRRKTRRKTKRKSRASKIRKGSTIVKKAKTAKGRKGPCYVVLRRSKTTGSVRIKGTFCGTGSKARAMKKATSVRKQSRRK